jgi:hypothetical protein
MAILDFQQELYDWSFYLEATRHLSGHRVGLLAAHSISTGLCEKLNFYGV